MGQVTIKLKVRVLSINSYFSIRENRGEKEKGGKAKYFYRRSTEFRRSEFIEPSEKVHLLDKGYA